MKNVLLFILLTVSSLANADQIRLLSDDKEALQSRVDIIQQAKKEILVEYFSVWNDDQSAGAFALLWDAADRGIKVKVIMDALSNSVPKAVIAALKQHENSPGRANIEIKTYNPMRFNIFKLTHRDHAKLLIVDGKRMITGGRNVGDKYFGLNTKRNFSDMDVFVGGTAVQAAREDFYAVWNAKIVKTTNIRDFTPEGLSSMCAGVNSKEMGSCLAGKARTQRIYEDEVQRIKDVLTDILTNSQASVVQSNTETDWLAGVDSNSDVQYLSHKPERFTSKNSAELSEALKEIASKTESDLNILSPYLIPTKNALALFEHLIKDKKVRVRIITNSIHSTDNLFAQAGYQHYKDRLIKMGVELYEFIGPDTAHAKVCVVDRHIGFVGTYNLDPRSAFINREVGILVKSSQNNQFAEDLMYQIELFRGASLLVGKDGLPQNEDVQKARLKELSPLKRAAMQAVKLIFPFVKTQI